MGVQDLETVEKLSLSDLNRLDTTNNKEQLKYCRATLKKIVEEDGWYYLGCPICHKQMRKKPDSELLICQQHDMQHGQYIFRVTVLIEDETDQAHAVLMGKEAEEICGISCEDLIIKKNCKNQRIIPQEILQLEGEIKLLKLKTGTKRDFLIKGWNTKMFTSSHQPKISNHICCHDKEDLT